MCRPIVLETWLTNFILAVPSLFSGVPTAINIIFDFLIASLAFVVKEIVLLSIFLDNNFSYSFSFFLPIVL